jgi:hypothetical protein
MGENDMEVLPPAAESQPSSPEPEAEEGAFATSDDIRGEPPEAQAEKPAEPKQEEKPAEFKHDEEPISHERFNKVYGRMRGLERELEKLQSAGSPSAGQPPAPEPQAARPSEGSFDSYDKYLEALADWRIDQRLATERHRVNEDSARKSLEKKLTEGSIRIPNFNEKAYLPQALVPIVMHCELPAEIADYWGKHPEEALDLLDLPREQQAYKVAQLEASIKAQKPPRRDEPQTRFPQTKGVDAVREGSEKPVSKMSTEEYINYMNKRDQIPYRTR